jgi:hypothetical protein
VEYSESFKTKMVQKMLSPNGRSAGGPGAGDGIAAADALALAREAGKVGVMNIPGRKWTLERRCAY